MNETLIAKIRELLTEVRDGVSYEATSIDVDFGDLGLDSLDTASLLLSVQEQFSVEISDEDADRLNTIRLLADFISSQ